MDSGKTAFTRILSELGILTSEISFPVLKNKDFPDLYLRSNLLGADSPFLEEIDFSETGVEKERILLLRDDFKCNYILGRWNEDSSYRIIGPYLYGSVDPLEIRKSLIKLGMRNVDLDYLSSYYHDLPVIRDENLLSVILQVHCVSKFGSDGFEISRFKMNFKGTSDVNMPIRQYSGYQMEIRSELYAREELFMEAISEGNLNQALLALQKLRVQDPEYRTTSTMRDMKNYFIVLGTICRLAAHKGGAHAHDIDRYSNGIARRIENAPSIEALRIMRGEMVRDYCDLVIKARNSVYSTTISQVVDFVDSHFEDELTLELVSETFNMSQSYLSSRFHRETGMTFSEYLARKRLEHAKLLLKSTEMTIGMISEDCGIQDNNYFSRIFKKYEGLTPQEYRRKNRK